MNFWQKLPDGFTALAPMEDVTDVAFRLTVKKAGRPNVFFTEFTNTDSFCNPLGRRHTMSRLIHDQTETPIVAQIWGSRPEKFASSAKEISKMGFDGIDINMGCPAKDVVKTGGGSALIKNLNLAKEIIAAAKTGSLPVSVKTRIGFNDFSNMNEWITFLLQQDISCLTVHLRTRKEMSKVPAHYDLIDRITNLKKQIAPQTKLVINGDIKDMQHIKLLKNQHPDVDGFMIGRGIFFNPFAFSNRTDRPSSRELIDLFNYHLDQFDKWQLVMPAQYSNNAEIKPAILRKFDPLKHFFKIYIKDFEGAKELRAKLYAAKNTNEVRKILNNISNP